MKSDIPIPGLSLPIRIGDSIYITQYFGQNAGLAYGRHNGIDIACPYRTPVYATVDGFVNWTGPDPASPKGYGNVAFIWLQKSWGYEERVYAHLDELKVEIGDQVKRGDLVGYADSTGYSTGHHLHYGLRLRDLNKQPLFDN